MEISEDPERAARFDAFMKKEREQIENDVLGRLVVGYLAAEDIDAEVTRDDLSRPLDSDNFFKRCHFAWDDRELYEDLKNWVFEKGFYLVGQTGRGKTTFMRAFALALMQKRVRKNLHDSETCKFINFGKLITALSKDNWARKNLILDRITAAEILFIDDLGTEKPSEFNEEILHNIVDTRRGRRSREGKLMKTYFTSNMRLDQLRYDPRTITRLRDIAMEIIL